MAETATESSVPKAMQARYQAAAALADAICEKHLDAEYAARARRALAALGRKRPSPLLSGRRMYGPARFSTPSAS